MSEQASFGEEAAADYDVMIDWDARLGRELPFFRDLFEAAGVERIVDLGCGTGRHAVEFARWGIEVVGVDPSEPMLEKAREHAEESGVVLDLRVGGFGELSALVDGPFDAVVVLGNAFMHVEGPEGARVALGQVAEVLRPGGLVVLHFLNHDRLLDTRPRTMPVRLRETPEGPRLFLRLLDYREGTIEFDFLTLSRNEAGEWDLQSRRSAHVVLPTSAVLAALEANGFGAIETYGSHARAPFDPSRDESVIMLARRG